ncbi:ArgK/MeaB family GTPase [Rhodovibrionaceae bacterium A322]
MSQDLFDGLKSGGKAALARALARAESAPESEEVLALMAAAYRAPRGQVIGITGPPGVGKSTLTGALIAGFRKAGRSVAVIAVDPSSQRSGGALLGDRVRLLSDPEDEQLFIRSMAARDRLGGLADITVGAMVLMRALYDIVLIETVGVGQSEADVAQVADSVLFCVQPGSGDSLQFMKAGIVEIPDLAVVTKADMGEVAERALSDLKGALSLAPSPGEWQVQALAVSASSQSGMAQLIAALEGHFAWLKGQENPQGQARPDEGLQSWSPALPHHHRLTRRRLAQAQHWLEESLKSRFGSWGCQQITVPVLAGEESPFDHLARISQRFAGVTLS